MKLLKDCYLDWIFLAQWWKYFVGGIEEDLEEKQNGNNLDQAGLCLGFVLVVPSTCNLKWNVENIYYILQKCCLCNVCSKLHLQYYSHIGLCLQTYGLIISWQKHILFRKISPLVGRATFNFQIKVTSRNIFQIQTLLNICKVLYLSCIDLHVYATALSC